MKIKRMGVGALDIIANCIHCKQEVVGRTGPFNLTELPIEVEFNCPSCGVWIEPITQELVSQLVGDWGSHV